MRTSLPFQGNKGSQWNAPVSYLILCVSCGLCVKVCPAGAKHIRNDLPRAQHLLQEKKHVYAAIAPSWRNNYPGVTDKQINQRS